MAGLKGYIVVDEELCKGCGLCTIACPVHIIELADYFNSHGYHPAVLTEPDKCTGCTLCAVTCPDVAIEVYREPVRKGA